MKKVLRYLRSMQFGMLLVLVIACAFAGSMIVQQCEPMEYVNRYGETWALITWILYAIYLHQRMRMKWQGKRMAWFAVIAVICVLFTFAGVNKLLPGLHSYAV